MRTPNRLRALSSLLLLAAGGALLGSLFLPIWHITLAAPQYPEGMGMFIWARTLTGEGPNDLGIINQLNHYIGMKPIVPESIPELRFIAPTIASFALFCFLAALRPRLLQTGLLLAALAGAGAVGMADFWRWEYDYGHNLDPKAAIRIPGMSYQPPLIGTAKLLNFEASSYPAAGGYLLFLAGLLIAGAFSLLWLAAGRPLPFGLRQAAAGSAPKTALQAAQKPALRGALPGIALCLFLAGCGQKGPYPIEWGMDACHHCKMTLVQKGFAAQRVNEKGKPFTFDAIECLLVDVETRPLREGERLYVSDWSRPDAALLPAESATFLRGGRIPSPMGGNLAAFEKVDSAYAFRSRLGPDSITLAPFAAL